MNLVRLKNRMNNIVPEATDEKGWRELFKTGMKIESCWTKFSYSEDRWDTVKNFVPFSHPTKTVSFRLKKK